MEVIKALPLSQWPEELLMLVLDFTDIDDLVPLASSSRRMYQAARGLLVQHRKRRRRYNSVTLQSSGPFRNSESLLFEVVATPQVAQYVKELDLDRYPTELDEEAMYAVEKLDFFRDAIDALPLTNNHSSIVEALHDSIRGRLEWNTDGAYLYDRTKLTIELLLILLLPNLTRLVVPVSMFDALRLRELFQALGDHVACGTFLAKLDTIVVLGCYGELYYAHHLASSRGYGRQS